MTDFNAFEEDQEFVFEKLQEGFIDHLEVVSRVVETQFFQLFLGSGGLQKLASSYPTPRKKEEVPLWLYLSAQITLRLHGSPGYSSLPYVLHCGGLRDALEEGQVERKSDPETGSHYLHFNGYNDKNSYDRQTPCDQDFVRKLARDTRPAQLEAWYGRDVAKFYKELEAYDPEGIFSLDGSYLFVPLANDNYENSKVAVFDRHNHLISKEEEKKLPPEEQKLCRMRRYYQMVGLSHTNRKQDYLLYTGATVLPGEGHEVHKLLPLVQQFQEAVGPGVMKLLLVDRGFIDGESIGTIKEKHKVDVIVPLKKGMDITKDAWCLAEVDKKPWQVWTPPAKQPPPDPPQRPERLRRAERSRQRTIAKQKKEAGVAPPAELVKLELKVIPRMGLWQACAVPIDVVLMREHISDGRVETWGLMTTREVSDPKEIRDLYHLRSSCEEGWRQTKCYWDLSGFRSPNFSLVVSQVIFVLLAYSLLEIFLLKTERGDMANQTRQRLLAELLPDGEKVAVYFENRVGYFSVREYSDILLNLQEGARRRLRGTIHRLRKAELERPALPFRPT
jgi:hypothetical protein